MRTSMAKNAKWWGLDDRASAYFSVASNQIPGTNFCYDSAGSSARDLLIFARFVMNGGVWNGKRYINEEFMKAAVAHQTDTYTLGNIQQIDHVYGYGYLIWKMPRDGFAFLGHGTQYAICDPETDFIFIINSANNQCEAIAYTILMHELYTNIIPNIGEPLQENHEKSIKFEEFLESQKLLHLENKFEDNVASEISGNMYVLEKNSLKINYIQLDFEGDRGVFEYEDKEGVKISILVLVIASLVSSLAPK